MVKGVAVGDILKALPREARAEFADKLKRESGVEVTFTVAGRRRKRQHRWDSAEGKVVAVRFSDEQYVMVSGRAAGKELSVGAYLKWLATRSHQKGKG